MATIHDTAAALLAPFDNRLPTSKLQALVYLAQGWSLALRGEALFPEPIQAWSAGPISRDLFRHHRREYSVADWPAGHAHELASAEAIVINAVVRNYGALSGTQLRTMAHVCGPPWARARDRANGAIASDVEIPVIDIRHHFAMILGSARA